MNPSTTISQPKVRNSNLELYRILVMISIVAHHYVVNSGLMDLMEADPLNPKSIFLYIVGMWGKTGINCFVLITGYFMCKSEITLRKFLKLLLEIEFYNIAIYFIFLATGYLNFSPTGFIFYILPIHNGVYDDFVSCFLLFYLLIPFLSAMVNHLNRKKHLILAITCLTIYTLIPLIPGFGISMNYVSWFCILFIIGSYLRLYPIKSGLKARYGLFIMLGSIFLATLSVLCILYVNGRGYNIEPYRFVADSNAPLAVLVSVFAFIFFKDLRIKQSKVINVIGGSTFAVLLIHANSNTMRQWLWKDLCDNVGHYATNDIYLHAIIITIAVFTVCSIIEIIRSKTIEKPLLDFMHNSIQRFRSN